MVVGRGARTLERETKMGWKEAWEREVARWKSTPEGKATIALYVAAEKAGMACELRYAHVEVSFENGEFCLFYEAETKERPEWEEVEPKFAESFRRANEWLKKYAAKHGKGHHVWYCASGYC